VAGKQRLATVDNLRQAHGVSIIEQYWSGVLRRLQAEVDTFNRLIAHAGTKGTENEVSLTRVLERLVPGRYGIGSGLLIDRHGNASKQMDIVVYDRANEPALMAQTNQVLFPIENVRFCIEVKTSLDKREIEDAEEKRASIRALSPIRECYPPLALVAYYSTQMVQTVARHLCNGVREGSTGRLDLVLALDQALIAGRAELFPNVVEGHNSSDYLVGIAPVQLVTNRVRQLGSYKIPAADQSSGQVLVGGNSYSVCSTPKGDVLAESSRALLLFCEAMLAHLAWQEGGISVLSEYLTPAGRDLLRLEE